eukprot:5699502-Pleurochrysis_carterae.AAC.2
MPRKKHVLRQYSSQCSQYGSKSGAKIQSKVIRLFSRIQRWQERNTTKLHGRFAGDASKHISKKCSAWWPNKAVPLQKRKEHGANARGMARGKGLRRRFEAKA